MPLDAKPLSPVEEARRQLTICNACRYCEGFCDVFPAVHAQRAWADGEIGRFADLCHNCRGCHYACQYTAPHEFDINLPAALANVRAEAWEAAVPPAAFARLFHRSGVAIAAALVVATALIIWAIRAAPAGGEGFYALMSHDWMVAIFAPAFVLPLVLLAVGVARRWRAIGRAGSGGAVHAAGRAALMTNLTGGHGEGCNYEDEDRYSLARRRAHQLTMWGFALCFASTSVATVMHYGFGLEAPYGLFSFPKLFGLPGGAMLTVGAGWLAALKLRADPALGATGRWGGEMAFTLLLGLTGATGLALYAARDTALMEAALALHLGAVLTLFVLTPWSKMAHGAFRLAALIADGRRQG